MEQEQAGRAAYLRDKGRVWVERVDALRGSAVVRFDPALGSRGPAFRVSLEHIDFSREWRF